MKKRLIIITKSNSITLPKRLREMLDLQLGDCLEYEAMANGSIVLVRKECCNEPGFHPVCKVAKLAKNL